MTMTSDAGVIGLVMQWITLVNFHITFPLHKKEASEVAAKLIS